MKKLLVLMLVLGMASLASAGLVLTNNGVDAGDEIGIDVLGELGVDDDRASIDGFEFELSITDGTLDTSGLTFPESWMFAPYRKGETASSVDVTGGDFFPKTGPLTLMNGILANAKVGSIITITSTASANAGEVYDSAIVTPEPMSLALLGLGGLFLRRRK